MKLDKSVLYKSNGAIKKKLIKIKTKTIQPIHYIITNTRGPPTQHKPELIN